MNIKYANDGSQCSVKWTNYSKLLRIQMDQPTILTNSQDSMVTAVITSETSPLAPCQAALSLCCLLLCMALCSWHCTYVSTGALHLDFGLLWPTFSPLGIQK